MVYGTNEEIGKDQTKVDLAIYQKFGSFTSTHGKHGLGYQRLTSAYNSDVQTMERESIGLKLSPAGFVTGTDKYQIAFNPSLAQPGAYELYFNIQEAANSYE